MIPLEKVIMVSLSVVFGMFAIWRRYVVEQTIPTVLQFGALGALVIVLMLIYKLASQWMDFKINQKVPEPARTSGDLSYNEQMARTIYDVNRTLSEVAVSNRQIVQQMERQTEIQDKQSLVFDRLVRLMDREHKLGMEGSSAD